MLSAVQRLSLLQKPYPIHLVLLLSPHSVTFSLFLVGEDGEPLEAQDALRVLQDTDALQQLLARGYRVTGFSALVATPTTAETAQATGEASES